MVDVQVLHHFSEDPSITRFRPHVPATNPGHRAGVWAIDEQHAPLYWFPRDCPQVTAWPRTEAERATFEATWATSARRVHAIEAAWLDRVRTTTIHRDDLPAAATIELRVVPSLWPLHDLAVSDRWDFGIVRMRNARAG